ncbi:MAG TPA: TadE/TadG family type IV pilus assembly protein [Terriglobales bacterium]|nr:TadE/TadG family type IV pilus assembly protein [Terriglobales bacterium]
MQTLRRILFGTQGAEIAEIAVVLPVLFLVLLGVFYFGRAYNIYGTINQAALQGARAAVAPSCATCGNVSLTASQIATNYVAPTLQASKLNPAQVQPLVRTACQCGSVGCGATVACDPAGVGATPSICVQQNVVLNTTSGAHQECGTSVAFQYPYNFNLPFQTFTLQMKAAAQMRTEEQQQ